MNSAIKLFDIDVSALAARLQDPSLYGEHRFRQDSYVHSNMTDIWVRYNDAKNIGPNFNDEHTSVWYPIAHRIPEIFDPVMRLMTYVGGIQLGAVLVTKLAPGGEIQKHIDAGWHAGYYEKFYIPIQNDHGAKFCWDDIEIDPRPGEVHWFNNSVTHWVNNDSLRDRIALIVCIKTLSGSLNDQCDK